MSKFHGEIGYGITKEVSPGVWEEQLVTRMYVGDLLQNTRRIQSSGQVNDNINIANKISIVADSFADENFRSIKYVTFMGAKWIVTEVDIQYPRLILTIGGVYNG